MREKLLNYLQQYEESYHDDENKIPWKLWYNGCFIYAFWIPPTWSVAYMISTYYWFLEWLLENDKIDYSKMHHYWAIVCEQNETWVSKIIKSEFVAVKDLRTKLSNSWQPVETLLSMLK